MRRYPVLTGEDAWFGCAMAAVAPLPVAPHWTWVDIEDEVPNAIINMTDIQLIAFAFGGAEYAFGAPADCP